MSEEMDEQRLAALELICERATGGPWVDLLHTYYERCEADRRQHGNRWYHGSKAASMPLVLIARNTTREGRPLDTEQIPRRVDKFDLQTVISLFWSTLPKRATVAVEGFLRDEDTRFITEARTALPEALAEIRRLRTQIGAASLMLEALEAAEEVGKLQRPFIDGINRGTAASHEVRQEASDRLRAATRRAYDLRVRALEAARTHTSGQGAPS